MDIQKLILDLVKKKGRVTTSDIVQKTGFTRAYAQRMIKRLTDEGLMIRVGKANQAHYIPASGKDIRQVLPASVRKILKNEGLAEDRVLGKIKEESSIFHGIADNVHSIISYAFTEMLNNAIEHSASEKIEMVVRKTPTDIRFTVLDRGVGIFNNIVQKKKLSSAMDAIQDLLKGKETTAPDAHSGEGIFFTSKIADRLIIRSFEKMIVFDNVDQDIYVKDIPTMRGTRIDFVLNLKSAKTLSDLFNRYTDDSFQFSKTDVKVKLYQQGIDYVSRSQARRILAGLEKFKSVQLDFANVATVGQAFADEIFRVWQKGYPDIKIEAKNCNENILFMINRAGR